MTVVDSVIVTVLPLAAVPAVADVIVIAAEPASRPAVVLASVRGRRPRPQRVDAPCRRWRRKSLPAVDGRLNVGDVVATPAA